MPRTFKKSLNRIFGLGFLFFGLFLIWQYWGSYPTYGWSLITGNIFEKNLSFIFEQFLVLFGFIYVLLLWQRRILTVAKVLGLLCISTVLLFVTICFLQSLDIFDNIPIWSGVLSMIGTIGFMLIGSVFFTMGLIVLGQLFLSEKEKNKIDMNYFLNFFIGFLVLSFIGLFVSKLGIFFGWIFGILLGLLVIFQKGEFKKILINIFVHKFSVSHHQLLVVALVLAISVLNFSQSFFPFSLGWDSHNHYLLTINTLIESGTLRMGIFPPFTEIILGVFGIFTGLSGVQFLLVFWGSFLPLIFYLVGRRFEISEKLNLVLSLALFLLPAIQFQLSKDLKIDIIYLQLLLVALAYIYTQRGLLLLGLAPLIKLTALWFFPVVVISIIYQFLWKNIKTVFFSLFILFLPLSIWMGVNLIDMDSIPKTINQWQTVLLNGSPVQPVLNTFGEDLNSTVFQEEVGRYSGFEINFFKKIWAIFTSPNIPWKSKQYIDLGFLWIWLLPLFLYVMWVSWRINRPKFVVALSGLFFLILWIFLSEGVAWYGFPFLTLLFLLSGWAGSREEVDKSLKSIVLVITLLSIIFGLWSRLIHVSQNHILTAMSWSMNPTNENRKVLVEMYYFEEFKVAKILNKNLNSNILKVGTMVKFWLKNGDHHIIEDPQLDQWKRLIQGRKENEMAQSLKENNIKYILIDRGAVSIETDEYGTLHKKFKDLDDFIKKGEEMELLKTLFNGKKIILLRVW